MLTERGIEANPDKCAAIIAMRSPNSVKEVQQLTGRMAALSRFVSAGGEKGHPYFQCLKRNSRFTWTDECEALEGVPGDATCALQATGRRPPPIILRSNRVGHQLCAGPGARPSAEAHLLCKQGLARSRDEIPISGEGVTNSSVLSQEASPLLPQFHSGGDDESPHPEKGSIKGQVYTNFVAELSPGGDPQEVELGSQWMLSVDGSSNQQGSGAGIILEGPNGMLIEQALRFAFKASNNQAEYEAPIAGMLLAKEMGVQSLLANSDSQLVTGQVTGEYQAKDPHMAAYLRYVEALKGAFATIELVHVPREQNARADLLAKLASSGKGGRQRTVIQETLKTPRKFVADNSVDVLHIRAAKGKPRSHRSLIQDTARAPHISTYAASPEGKKGVHVCALEEGDTWITPYRQYIADGILPAEPRERKKIKKNSARYTLVDGVLFRHGFTHPILTCVSGDECTRIMLEIHEGICGSHVGGRSLASKVIRAGFYWPSVREDCVRYAQQCKQCQIHADWHKAPPEELRSIYSPWPFHTWGIDILGPFPLAIRKMKYLIVAIEYFTKWIEAEPLGKLCEEVGIKQVFASVEHPQTNGQVESANRVFLRGLKRRLEKAKGAWAEEVPRIVWAYHTTPQSSTMETPFSLVYGSDAMIPVEIHESSPRFLSFVAEESNEERRVNLDQLD
ncbi:uncharacterized protein [Phaseolus vulgaris]|uniref:uncharacterized protein n=1 Tax=Phaseolus vulgaris TaxID=3885 RepID=UPI0035CC1463